MKDVVTKHYPESLKEKIVEEYYTNYTSYIKLSRKYQIPKTTLEKWIVKAKGNYQSEIKIKEENLTFGSLINIELPMKNDKNMSTDEMEKRIKALEKQLEYEQMRADVYDTMIDVAEEMFNIEIRKKHGAKQSKK